MDDGPRRPLSKKIVALSQLKVIRMAVVPCVICLFLIYLLIVKLTVNYIIHPHTEIFDPCMKFLLKYGAFDVVEFRIVRDNSVLMQDLEIIPKLSRIGVSDSDTFKRYYEGKLTPRATLHPGRNLLLTPLFHFFFWPLNGLVTLNHYSYSTDNIDQWKAMQKQTSMYYRPVNISEAVEESISWENTLEICNVCHMFSPRLRKHLYASHILSTSSEKNESANSTIKTYLASPFVHVYDILTSSASPLEFPFASFPRSRPFRVATFDLFLPSIFSFHDAPFLSALSSVLQSSEARSYLETPLSLSAVPLKKFSRGAFDSSLHSPQFQGALSYLSDAFSYSTLCTHFLSLAKTALKSMYNFLSSSIHFSFSPNPQLAPSSNVATSSSSSSSSSTSSSLSSSSFSSSSSSHPSFLMRWLHKHFRIFSVCARSLLLVFLIKNITRLLSRVSTRIFITSPLFQAHLNDTLGTASDSPSPSPLSLPHSLPHSPSPSPSASEQSQTENAVDINSYSATVSASSVSSSSSDSDSAPVVDAFLPLPPHPPHPPPPHHHQHINHNHTHHHNHHNHNHHHHHHHHHSPQQYPPFFFGCSLLSISRTFLATLEMAAICFVAVPLALLVATHVCAPFSSSSAFSALLLPVFLLAFILCPSYSSSASSASDTHSVFVQTTFRSSKTEELFASASTMVLALQLFLSESAPNGFDSLLSLWAAVAEGVLCVVCLVCADSEDCIEGEGNGENEVNGVNGVNAEGNNENTQGNTGNTGNAGNTGNNENLAGNGGNGVNVGNPPSNENNAGHEAEDGGALAEESDDMLPETSTEDDEDEEDEEDEEDLSGIAVEAGLEGDIASINVSIIRLHPFLHMLNEDEQHNGELTGN